MRASTAVILSAALALVGCSPSPGPDQSATAEPSAPAPTPTASTAALPQLETVLRVLDSAPGDDRPPVTRLGAVLDPDQPFTLGDERDSVVGPAVIRVACSSVGAEPVSIVVAIGGEPQGTFSAPCGEAPNSIVVTQEAAVEFTAEYLFTVSSTATTVVAVGVVPDAAE